MIVAVDVGNTRTKIALFENDQLKRERAFTSHEDFFTMAADFCGDGIDTAVIGSVVPQLTSGWQDFFGRRATRVHVAGADSPWGFQIGVEEPEKVGVDRLANMEAVLGIPGAVLVVDAGTATKFDLLEGVEKRSFPGGAIAPGVEISYQALMIKAAQLKPIELDKHSPVVGYNTETAIRSGVVHGFAAMVDGMIMRIVEDRKLPSLAAVIATGGSAHFLNGRARLITKNRPNLTLEGLHALAKKI